MYRGDARHLVRAGLIGGKGVDESVTERPAILLALTAPSFGSVHSAGHDLRHTAVALWMAAGANPKEVAARAGHTPVSFTLDRYGHLLSGSEQRLNDALVGLAEGALATAEVMRRHRRHDECARKSDFARARSAHAGGP